MLTVKSVLDKYENKYTLPEKKNRANTFESWYTFGYGIGGILVPLVYAILCNYQPDFVFSLTLLQYIIACFLFIIIMAFFLFMSSLYRRVQSQILEIEYDSNAEVKQVEALFDQYSSLIEAISCEFATPDLDCHTLYTLVNNAIYEMIRLKYAPNSTITVSIYKGDDSSIEMVSHKFARRELMNPHFYRKTLKKDEIKNYYFARRIYDEKNTKLFLNRRQIQKKFYFDDNAGKTFRNYSQYIGYVYHSDHVKYLVEVISYFDSKICETNKVNELVTKYIIPGCYFLKLIDRIDERGKYA